MKIGTLMVVAVFLAGADGALCYWRSSDRASADIALIDKPLLEVSTLDRASRIVVREKPQSRVLSSNDDGFEVSVIAAPDAPIRETILKRDTADSWVVSNCFGLAADANWLGQTMRDLTQGHLVRELTSDSRQMGGLKLGAAEVLFEDEKGNVIRRLEFGRMDGEQYQMVRIDGGSAFLSKHSAELVGDPLAWINPRVLDFSVGDVQRFEMPFRDRSEAPLVFRRGARGARLVADENSGENVSASAERWLTRMIATPLLFAVGLESPVVIASRPHPLAIAKITLFDGRTFQIAFSGLQGADTSLVGNRPESLVLAFYACSDPESLATKYAAKAVLVYNRGGTFGALPETRGKLFSPTLSTMR